MATVRQRGEGLTDLTTRSSRGAATVEPLFVRKKVRKVLPDTMALAPSEKFPDMPLAVNVDAVAFRSRR